MRRPDQVRAPGAGDQIDLAGALGAGAPSRQQGAGGGAARVQKRPARYWKGS
jgi:hypothetical protein